MEDKKLMQAQIIAFLNGDASFEDAQALYDWICSSEANASFFTQIKDIWEASLSDISVVADTENEWKKLHNKLKLQVPSTYEKTQIHKKRLFSGAFLKIAASLLTGILIGATVFYLFHQRNQPIVYQSLIVPYGSMSELVLQDSSVIYLNAGTQIRYSLNYGNHVREVFLTGEALFDIKHIHNQPFIVHTNVYDVKVLGTEFNVRAYDMDKTTETTLQKGQVWISSMKSKAYQDVSLKPGQQFIYDKESNRAVIKNVDAVVFTSWKDSFSSFTKLTLHDLFVLMEQRYHVTIEVQRPNILNYHYSGTISQEDDIKSILEIVQKTLPIQYEINNNKIIIR